MRVIIGRRNRTTVSFWWPSSPPRLTPFINYCGVGSVGSVCGVDERKWKKGFPPTANHLQVSSSKK